MRYNWISVLFVLSAEPLCLLATHLSPHWNDMHVKHAWKAVPMNWETLGHPPADTTIDLYVALKPRNENALIDTLYEVSDPRHPRYGLHLSKEQVAELVAPHPHTLYLINSWLEHHGVPSSSVSTSHGGGWLKLTGVPVSQANTLLGASYQLYQHAETKDRVLCTLSYSLPAVLHAHVKTVVPTTYFDSPPPLQQTLRKRTGGAQAKPASGELVKVLSSRDNDPVTPSFLRRLYKTEGYELAAADRDRNKLGVAAYLGGYPIQDDLTTFMRKYRSDGADATYTLVLVDDGDLPDEPDEEVSFDIQYAEAIAYPTPHTVYTTIGQGTLAIWLDYVIGQSDSDLPHTISTSYGTDEQDIPEDLAIALCDLFGHLGTRGVTVIFSSGDDAVGRGECKVNDGSGKVQFLPTFPASCPYVTSVGGTISELPEVAASFSSGGFSNYFKRPTYQDDAVFLYLGKLGNRHSGLYNATSRGFPDVAAQSYNFAYILNGETRFHAGTSCAAPTVAAVISLLNDYKLSKGEDPLGWLNPWLYGEGRTGFNDITVGSNPGCGTTGFRTTEGWDPVTGLGTPDFRELQKKIDGSRYRLRWKSTVTGNTRNRVDCDSTLS